MQRQADRLVELGVHEVAGLTATELTDEARPHADVEGALLVVHHERLAPSVLVPFLRHAGKPGFVVVDMTDVDEFTPVPAAAPPSAPVYLVHDVDRGDDLAGRSPAEAEGVLAARSRSPLSLTEGLHWLVQQPEALERGHCFMTIGSRRRRPDGTLDARTPALWISNGTGRDGPERADAPKVGWCWAGNRHGWLGFASTTGRAPLAPRTAGTLDAWIR